MDYEDGEEYNKKIFAEKQEEEDGLARQERRAPRRVHVFHV